MQESNDSITERPPIPPFTQETAIQKIRMAENAWNGQSPEAIAKAYTPDSRWRNRDTFVQGRDQIVQFLSAKWEKERNYRLIKELWAYSDNRIAVRYVYEYHDENGQWFRAHGNENWQFDNNGLMEERHASINDVPIQEQDRKFHWPTGPRPADHPGLSELGL